MASRVIHRLATSAGLIVTLGDRPSDQNVRECYGSRPFSRRASDARFSP